MAAALSILAAAPVCKELKEAPPKQLIDYLNREPSKQTTSCVVFAILKQDGPEYASSVPLLVARYLDFEDPYFEVMKLEAVHDHPWAPEEKYPAIIALIGVGEPSVTTLMEAIRAGSLSERATHNAVDVIMDVYGRQLQEPEAGVKLLNDANRSARDAAVAARFLAAAREAVHYCPDENRLNCEMVLWDQSGK
jgi:hypothetical protein